LAAVIFGPLLALSVALEFALDDVADVLDLGDVDWIRVDDPPEDGVFADWLQAVSSIIAVTAVRIRSAVFIAVLPGNTLHIARRGGTVIQGSWEFTLRCHALSHDSHQLQSAK
jgi:hypothetical protein